MLQRSIRSRTELTEVERASAARGREITQSLLGLTTETIEEFEAGKTPEQLKLHYLDVHNRLKRASFGQAMSED